MVFEPINIFSHRIDPRGVVDLLRSLSDSVEIVGADDDWQQAVVTLRSGLLRRGKAITFGHSAEYYDGEDWPRQVLGMMNYFANFPDSDRKADVLRLIGTFRFALAVPQHDLDINSNDERLKILYAVCRHLDGAIFTPSALRDASGRILIDAAGGGDPSAVFPAMLPTHDLADDDDDEDGELSDVENEDADEYETVPPTADRVARRAMALAAVTNRGLLENEAGNLDDPESIRGRIETWIHQAEIADELEPDEWEVIQRPIGTLDLQSVLNATWRLEGLGVLLWALGRCELPPYDQLVEPADLYAAVRLFDDEAGQLAHEAQLRSEEELQEMAEHLLMFHWRMRDFSLRPQATDFVELSQGCWFGTFDITKFRIVDRDLAIGEQAIADAPPDEVQRVHSTAMERHLAINWLLGFSEVYSQTDTST
jgi:hypothetical protein